MSDNPLCQAALAYVGRLGWPVFPCHWVKDDGTCSCGKPDCGSPGKHPLTPQGFKDASPDAEHIRQWWAQWPEANIGVPTGAASGFDVLDVDPRHGGEESLAGLEARCGKLPPTVEALTGGGGRHVLFRHREGVCNSTGRLPGLDVRGEGGYIVVAPSIHQSGRAYAWEVSSRPGEVELAEWPEWLLDALHPLNGKARSPAPAIQGAILEGERNATLTSLAGTMRRRGMGEPAILAALREENAARCTPPLPEGEVEQIARSVVRYEPPIIDQRPPEAGQPAQERRTVSLAEVDPVEPCWLSRPRIPAGVLTLMFGAGGDGKSYVCLAISAALSQGAGLWGAEGTGQPSTSLYLTGEDSLPLVRRRLDLLGADPQYIRGCSEPFTFDKAGFAFIEREIVQHQVELGVIDPMVTFLGRELDFHRANEARAILAPLNKIAERTGAALILVTHITKGTSTRAAYRALGSSDFINAARSALLVGCDPDEPRHKALCHVKCNHGPLADPVGFEIDPEGRFFWQVHTDLTTARILGAEAGEDERQASRLAEELLRDLCQTERPAEEIYTQAKAEGLSERTLRRVAGRLCERRREGFGKGSIVYWKLRSLPASPSHTGHTGQVENVASMESLATMEHTGHMASMERETWTL